MIEIVYKEEKKEAAGNEGLFRLPKNIRQIGECRGSRKIYLEDYAYTFLRRLGEENRERGRAGILLGRYNWLEGTAYLFIKSALDIREMEVSREHIRFTDQIWSKVHEEMEKYFKGQEILGWYLNLPGFPMEINEVILRAHLNHFGGNDKVLFLIEPTEKEEAFYTYDSGRLRRESGFYIYYEKNEPMQSYMIDRSGSFSQEQEQPVRDRAVADFRRRIEEKQEEKKKREKGSGFFGLTAAAAAATLILALSYTGIGRQAAEFLKGLTGGEEETVSVDGDSVLAVTEEPTPTPEAAETPEAQKPSGEETAGTPEPQEETGDENAEPPQPSATPAPADPASGEIRETAAGIQEYTVQMGDTMTKICRQYYGNLEKLTEICALNGISQEDIIYPGQKIRLPQ